MCFFNHAKYWTGRKDLRTVWIPANSSVEVEVQENWCTPAITFSHWKNGKRYVTYGDSLTVNYGGHLRQYYSVL